MINESLDPALNPRIKSIEYYPNGQVQKVEFHPPVLPFPAHVPNDGRTHQPHPGWYPGIPYGPAGAPTKWVPGPVPEPYKWPGTSGDYQLGTTVICGTLSEVTKH